MLVKSDFFVGTCTPDDTPCWSTLPAELATPPEAVPEAFPKLPELSRGHPEGLLKPAEASRKALLAIKNNYVLLFKFCEGPL